MMDLESVSAIMKDGGAIGGGALGGAWLIISFIRSQMKDIRDSLKELSTVLKEIDQDLKVSRAKYDIEIEHIKAKILEIERRLEKLERS